MTTERQVKENLYPNQNQHSTFFCIFFNIILEDIDLNQPTNHLNLLLR